MAQDVKWLQLKSVGLCRDSDGKVTPEELAAAAMFLKDSLDKESVHELISNLAKDAGNSICFRIHWFSKLCWPALMSSLFVGPCLEAGHLIHHGVLPLALSLSEVHGIVNLLFYSTWVLTLWSCMAWLTSCLDLGLCEFHDITNYYLLVFSPQL